MDGEEKKLPARLVNFIKYFFSLALFYLSLKLFLGNHALLGFLAALGLSVIPYVFSETTSNAYRTLVAAAILCLSMACLWGNDDYHKIAGVATIFLMFVAFNLGESIFPKKPKPSDTGGN